MEGAGAVGPDVFRNPLGEMYIMARAKSDPTPQEAFLAPLAKLAARDPGIEALVFWANPGWEVAPTEELEAEEVAFYAEGLIPEGFRLEWRIIAGPGETRADHIRLYVWEDGPAPGPETADWQVLSQAVWAGGAQG